MIDLEAYRRRIGSFIHYGRRSCRNKNIKNQTKVRRKVLAFLTIIFITAIFTAEDSRTGKNRQRGNSFRKCTDINEREKSEFNTVRGLEAKLAKSKSHLNFFRNCIESGVCPKNIAFNNSFNISSPNHNIESKFQEINDRNIKEKMTVCISHLQLTCSEYLYIGSTYNRFPIRKDTIIYLVNSKNIKKT